jgi:YD repeat-containing protein
MPGQTMTYDSLGRLTSVTIGGATSAYTYDPLDRLRTVTRSGAVQRFRYVGGTTEAAQVLDGAGAVLRSIANDWTGTRLVEEAPGYLWAAWMKYFSRYDEPPPWKVFTPLR